MIFVFLKINPDLLIFVILSIILGYAVDDKIINGVTVSNINVLFLNCVLSV